MSARCLCLLSALWLLATAVHGQDQSAADLDPTFEVTLVTLGPGATYWERFGHNAILIDDGDRSLLYNFGLFDFREQNFLLNFMRGKMTYLAAAFEGTTELAHYRNGNRQLRLQTLALDGAQIRRLIEHLEWHRTPPNDKYRYDYYLQNCSTKVRDAVDLALDGQLRAVVGDTPAAFGTFRDHTRRLTQSEPWLFLGTDLALGPLVDQPASRWEELFLPMELADVVQSMTIDGRPLVAADVTWPIANAIAEPESAPSWWMWFLLSGIALGALVILVGSPVVRVWGLAAGLVGLVLAILWMFTDHEAGWRNLNLLLFAPTHLIYLVRPLGIWSQRVSSFHLLLSAMALLGSELTAVQNISYWLLLTAPIHLAVWVRVRGSHATLPWFRPAKGTMAAGQR